MVSTGLCSLKALEDDPFLPLPGFWYLPTILGVPRLVDALLQSLSVVTWCYSLGVFLYPNFPLLIRTSVFELMSTLRQYDFILITCVKILFPNKVTLTVTGSLDISISLWRAQYHHLEEARLYSGKSAQF